MARIFLAGSENVTHLQALLENGASNVLFSFYYIARRGQMNQLFDLLDSYKHVKVFLDSGAFSYRVGTSKFGGNQQSPVDYFERYLKFVQRYGHRFEFAAEFDVDEYDEHCTPEQLEEWRSRLVAAQTTAIIPVWHPNREDASWKAYCQDPRYTHIGFGTGGEVIHHGIQSRMVNYAHHCGKTVHGFAQTKILTTLRYIKFDTIDSTSWKMGERFGQTYIFWKNRWTVLAKHEKDQRYMYRRYFKAIGCNWHKILADDIEEVRKANVIAWENLSRRMQVIHKSHVGLSTRIQSRDGGIAYQTGDGYRGRALTSEPNTLVLEGNLGATHSADQVHEQDDSHDESGSHEIPQTDGTGRKIGTGSKGIDIPIISTFKTGT